MVLKRKKDFGKSEVLRAIDGARTRGLDLGKVARYQLRHYRISEIVTEKYLPQRQNIYYYRCGDLSNVFWNLFEKIREFEILVNCGVVNCKWGGGVV